MVGGRPFAVPAGRLGAAGLVAHPRRHVRRADAADGPRPAERPTPTGRRRRTLAAFERRGPRRGPRRRPARWPPPTTRPRATSWRPSSTTPRPLGRRRLHAALRRRRRRAGPPTGPGTRPSTRPGGSAGSTGSGRAAEIRGAPRRRRRPGGARPASAAAGGVSPVWLSGPVQVRRTPVDAGRWSPGPPARPTATPRAPRPPCRSCARVLPGWRRGLVVEVPASARGARAGPRRRRRGPTTRSPR